MDQIDSLAAALEKVGFVVDKDGDGYHLELLDYPDVVVFIALSEPFRRNWPNIWDGCKLEVEAEDSELRNSALRDITLRLKRSGVLPSPAMTKFEITIYDPENQILSPLARAIGKKTIYSFFPSGGQQYANVEYFSPISDPILLADTLPAATAAKRLFLQSAARSVVAASDLRGLSMVVTALRELLAGNLEKLFVISTLPMEMIAQMATDEEKLRIRNAVESGRFVIRPLVDAELIDWICAD
jgi:hypothetical protein